MDRHPVVVAVLKVFLCVHSSIDTCIYIHIIIEVFMYYEGVDVPCDADPPAILCFARCTHARDDYQDGNKQARGVEELSVLASLATPFWFVALERCYRKLLSVWRDFRFTSAGLWLWRRNLPTPGASKALFCTWSLFWDIGFTQRVLFPIDGDRFPHFRGSSGEGWGERRATADPPRLPPSDVKEQRPRATRAARATKRRPQGEPEHKNNFVGFILFYPRHGFRRAKTGLPRTNGQRQCCFSPRPPRPFSDFLLPPPPPPPTRAPYTRAEIFAKNQAKIQYACVILFDARCPPPPSLRDVLPPFTAHRLLHDSPHAP